MPKTITRDEEENAIFLDALHTRGMEKTAEDMLTEFIRTTLRERSYWDELIEPQTVTAADLDRRHDDDAPYIVVDIEPSSAAAVTVGFGHFPSAVTIRSRRVPFYFSRVMSPRMMADEIRLRTWNMDIRQVMTDNMVRDMLAEKDANWQAAADRILGTIDQVSPFTLENHYRAIPGEVQRDGVVDGFKIMNQLPGRFEPVTCVANTVTMKDFEKWGRDEMGGDLSEQIAVKGFALSEFLRRRWIFTIKRNLIGDGSIRHFASKECVGKNYTFYEPQMYIERRGPMLSFMLYAEWGGGIAGPNGVTGSEHN